MDVIKPRFFLETGFCALSDQDDGNTVKYLVPYIPILGHLIQTV
jgi:hypothetical protein